MPRDPVSFVVGATAAQVIGGMVPQMSPFVIGGLMDGLSLSERDSGFIVSIELLALAVTATTIAPILPRFSYRRVSLVAVVLALVAQGGSIFSVSLGWLAVFRALAGAGEGALYAVSLSVVASHCKNPDKVYGYFQVVWALVSVALFTIGGQLTAAFAHRGILALIAGVTLVLAPILLLIPDDRAKSGFRTEADMAQASPSLGIMTFAAIVLYLTASAAIYAFSAPLGERAGLDTTAVGYVLTIASLIGLAGAGVATVVNVRWGRAIPILGFSVGFVLVALALCLWRSPTVYIVAVIASVVIYYFSIPYLFGLAAALDRNGRWAAAAGSAYLLGFAAGPLVAGSVIATAGYAGLAGVCVAITAAAWGLAVVVIQRLSWSGAPPTLRHEIVMRIVTSNE
ncbi:putative MFS family arabinose efflux permease [Phyllobacterium bourgognense]|uniref:Putative MFS family arabinose efflux permease n=2 Tax=Phyllobacterium bourgognense TaxID=314236 RepID=A0A368YUC4_9HYPH|nr:putative MFS family arabinose efflux permease [Phyllobacterium bourgognense]